MDERLMSLSFSMESNKGVYALLLGSGISFSASIPTGWGILKLLCRRIMELEGEDHLDEIQWYTEKFGKEPLYDEIIGMLAKTPAERNGLLSEFFEPSAEDIEEKRKIPTEAHRSIASLVQEGYIKVIITTNFDRLLEQSLDDLNVQYQTLYHESDIEGMKPLVHSDCTVLKLHGDYRDTRFKNITDELSSYPEPINEMLNRIFDEYGLVISGWSAEWDTALKDAIKSVKGRRYSWFWHSFNEEVSGPAKELIAYRDANVIVDQKGADHFFKGLMENVKNISSIKQTNPENLQVKVNRVKNYLSNNKDIELQDLVTDETKHVIQTIQKMNPDQKADDELVKQWVEEIKEVITPLSVIMSIITYYKGARHEQLIIETLERLTTLSEHNGITALLKLKELPVQAVFYSVGVSLIKNKDFKLLDKVFVKPLVRDSIYKGHDFSWYMSPRRGLHEAVRALENGQRYHLPFEVTFMQPFTEKVFLENQLCLDKEEIITLYDIFEFLRAIKHRYLGNDDYFSGCFGYRHDRRHLERFLLEGASQDNWDVLELFGNSRDKFLEALEMLVDDLNKQSYFSGQGLLAPFNKED